MPPKKAKPKMSSKIPKKPIPEDFELSDEEPTTIKLDEDQKLTSLKILCLNAPCAMANYR